MFFKIRSKVENLLLKTCVFLNGFFIFFSLNITYEGEMRDIKSNITKLIKNLKFYNEIREYELLHLLEFDSTRKKMSVIVKCLSTENIMVLVKGAEDTVFNCCSIDDNIQHFSNAVNTFAENGWRTLVFAYRILSISEYEYFNKLLLEASNDLNFRNERLAEIVSLIETNLTVVGVTGIEDRLQEDCAATLNVLRIAGIKIWVLTGDKKETALNISKACKHFSRNTILFMMTNWTTTDVMRIELDDILLKYIY